MATTHEVVGEFANRLQVYRGMWQGLEVKWVATKGEPSLLLALHGLLTDSRPLHGKDLLSDSSTVEARWETLPFRQVRRLLQGLAGGAIWLGGRTRNLTGFQTFDMLRDFSGDSYSFDVERPNFWLRGYGTQVQEIVDEARISADLRKIGYGGLYEASKDTLGFFVGGGTGLHIYLVAPIYITTKCSLTQRGLTVEIRCHRCVKARQVWVSYRAGETPTTGRGKFTFTEYDIAKVEGSFYWLRKHLETGPEAKDARIWTYHKKEPDPLQQNWVQVTHEEVQPVVAPKKTPEIVDNEWVQKTILAKLKASKTIDPTSPELKINDLLKDPDLVEGIGYPEGYVPIVQSTIRYLIEQGLVHYDKPLWDEHPSKEGFVLRRYRELDGSTQVSITSDGMDCLELLIKEAGEREEENTPRPIPSETPSALPSSLVGMLRLTKGDFCLFIGAGASASAGVQCGKAFRNGILSRLYGESGEEKFRREFKERIADQELTLEMIMSGLKQKFGDLAFRVLEEQVDGNLEPPPGYYSLAYLIRHGFFKVVFTVNVDELLEKALNEEIGPSEYVLMCEADRFRSIMPTNHPLKPLLVKLHGTYTLRSTLIVSWEDIQELPREKAIFVEYYTSNFPTIFVGYSGRDPDIRSVLRRSSELPGRTVFWVSPNDLEKEPKQILGWYNSDPNTHNIRMSSDAFFDELEHHLIGGYPRLRNEVSVATLDSGAVDEKTAVTREQIKQAILQHPIHGPRVSQCYKGRDKRLIRDIQASCESLAEKGHIECQGMGTDKRYWD